MAEKHFYEQDEYTRKYLIPYFQKYIKDFHKLSVLEVGCAEGGLLNVFYEMGMKVAGVELSPERAHVAKEKNKNLEVLVGDITDLELPNKIGRDFDLVIMREVIEHVPNKQFAFGNLNKLTRNNGYLFISFPPKYSPFAGHQQIAKSFLKAIPYLHLIPSKLLQQAAKLMKEKPGYVEEIKLHYSTGMEINKFEMLYKSNSFVPVKSNLFLFRPIYAYRFGLPTIKLPNIPVLREAVSFGCEVILQKKQI